MKLKRKKPTIKQAMTTCCWCGLKIKDEGPIYAIGCKKRPEVDISKYESKVMPVKLSTLGRTIWSIVPPVDSDARMEGNDFMFTLCSEDCGDQLKETLDIEKEIGELIFSVEHIY
jgi:hypothetical protein